MLSSVISSLGPVILVSNLTGFFSFDIDIKTKSATIAPWNIFLIFFTLAINFTLGCVFWNFSPFGQYFFAEIAKFSVPIMFSVNHLLLVFIMVWNFINRRKIVKLFVVLSEIDVKLRDFGSEFDPKKQRKILTIVIIAFISLIILNVAFAEIVQFSHGFAFNPLNTVAMFWMFILEFVLVLKFVVIMMAIGKRFELMNNCIRNNKNVAKIHLKIVNAVKIFNGIFGIPIMLAFANYFSWICMTTFSIVMVPKEQMNFETAITMIIGISLSWTFLFVMINAAEKITRAKEVSIMLLFKAMAENCGNCEKIQGLLMQILNTNVSFSCRLFDFNWKMMFNVSKKIYLGLEKIFKKLIFLFLK
jgi:hypothetical protein